MLLKEYLEKYGVSKTPFAKRIGKRRELVYLIISRGHIPKADVAAKIEEVTEGKVLKEDVLYASKSIKLSYLEWPLVQARPSLFYDKYALDIS